MQLGVGSDILDQRELLICPEIYANLGHARGGVTIKRDKKEVKRDTTHREESRAKTPCHLPSKPKKLYFLLSG